MRQAQKEKKKKGFPKARGSTVRMHSQSRLLEDIQKLVPMKKKKSYTNK